MTILKTILLLTLIYYSSSTVFITPAYPPTAYQYQYYSVVFRIRGADFPIFKFSGLPSGIIGTSDGTLNGVPTVSGSFNIKLTYLVGSETGSKSFIMTVTPDTKKATDSVVSVKNSKSLAITFPDSFIFRAGQKIILNFQVQYGTEPYIWSYSNLINGLTGNPKVGQIQGVIKQSGYYNINLQVADKAGKSASAYITLNIQPMAKMQSSKSLVEVLLQNGQNKLDPGYLQFVLSDASDDYKYAVKNVTIKKQVVLKNNATFIKASTLFDKVNNTYFDAQNDYIKMNDNYRTIQSIVADSLKSINEVNKTLNLALTQLNSSIQRLNESKQSVKIANKRQIEAKNNIQYCQSSYQLSQGQYKKSQLKLKSLNQSKLLVYQDYKLIAQQLQNKKQQLQNNRRIKLQTELNFNNSKDMLQLVTLARDNAQIQFKKIDFSLTSANDKLNFLLQKMYNIRVEYNKIKKQYNEMKFDYQIKLNSLYLAQMRKQTADRATAFALAQGSLSDHNTDSQNKTIGSINTISDQIGIIDFSVSFMGCNDLNYPPISGMSQIKKVIPNNSSYILLSGRTLMYGNCSVVEPVKIGDWIKFEGYVIKTFVNAVKIQKTTLLQ